MSFGYRSFLFVSATFASFIVGCSSGSNEGKPDTSCAAICKRITAPKCENAATDCIGTCESQVDETPASCKSKLDALTACFASATFQCDAEGVPTANGCKTQLTAWTSCVRDAGGGNGNGGDNVCAPSADDDACDSCGKQKCCAEFTACADNADCMSLLDCLGGCTTEACLNGCFEQFPEAQATITAAANCTTNKCPACSQ